MAVNDQIIEVDGRSIQGYTNQQAVEMLRSTGKVVRLKLVRYVHGLKFEQLQQAIELATALGMEHQAMILRLHGSALSAHGAAYGVNSTPGAV